MSIFLPLLVLVLGIDSVSSARTPGDLSGPTQAISGKSPAWQLFVDDVGIAEKTNVSRVSVCYTGHV